LVWRGNPPAADKASPYDTSQNWIPAFAGMTVMKWPAASINRAGGKNKDFFRVDLEAGDSFFIIYLIGIFRLEGESRLKIERTASQL